MQLKKSGNIKTISNLTKPVKMYYYLFKHKPNILISMANFNLEIYRRPKWVFTKYCIEYYIFSLNLTILFTVINLVPIEYYIFSLNLTILFTVINLVHKHVLQVL